MALDEAGQAWAWGWNGYGQRGDGTRTTRTSPVRVVLGAIPVGTRLSEISAGWSDTAALPGNAEDWPTVEVVPGGRVLSDSAGRVRLVIDDDETPPGRLVVSATSDNQTVVSDSDITLAGRGAHRSMTVRTDPRASGSATITVRVSDGSLTGAAVVTVLAGTAHADHITGTNGPDMVFAGDGDDTINARGGIDLVAAGRGEDHVRGGTGDDLVQGGRGNDRLTGGRGAGHFSGGSGTDVATDFRAREGDTEDGTIP